MTTVCDPTPQIFELPAVLDLRAAPALAACLAALRGAPLAIDASRVERLGGQCLQVLLAAAQSWRTDAAALTLSAPTPAFVDGLRLMGLSPAALTTEEPEA
ncbi:chemotaxis protein CheX [Mesorhizobium soli]|uniref:STAS domain-containing protein n=1 Tax=Pseudaminobacter soli (ex Li et al. 2025) TaxID=1295366 RepID=UPI002472F115|nr:STAS domain-containing protein [Mesorhizobium soli]MDH6235254.1 chemotaxis protein CheX [Mesorhizobium soli]